MKMESCSIVKNIEEKNKNLRKENCTITSLLFILKIVSKNTSWKLKQAIYTFLYNSFAA